MQVGDIIEINELARVAAGVFQTGEAGAPRRIDVGGGDRILAVGMARPRYNQQVGGVTSQMNTADEFLEYFLTGDTTSVANYSKSAAPLNAASEYVTSWHIPPFIFPFRDIQEGAVWSTLTSPSYQRFQNSFSHVYNIMDTGNYKPIFGWVLPLKNNTDASITLTLPASSIFATATQTTYSPMQISSIVSGSASPSLTDTPTVTHHLSAFGSASYNNTNAAAVSITVPAGYRAVLVVIGHYYLTQNYSNQYNYSANVGFNWQAVQALYESGLDVSVNVLNALMLDSVSGVKTTNKYAELFIPQMDAYTGAR
jgi:hypothetical protein